jgi:AraC-like DNA-binding protein
MEIQTFYPENPILKKHIEYYYFLKTGSPDFTSVYYAFPNTLQAFNIHHHARCKLTPGSATVSGDKRNNYLMIVQGKYELPLFVKLNGILDKVTIIFKPLGLNHFIKRPLIEVAPGASQVFTDWYDDKNCTPFLNSFFHTNDYACRVNILENYLLSCYRPLEEEIVLTRVLDLLTNFNRGYSASEIAESIAMNVRSFDRLFHKHLGISPVAFRKIARFRHSLNNRLFNDRFKSLTEIGYESNFYDQSYFIKIYRKMTGDNPSLFFNSIEKLANKQLILKFINK